MYITQMENGHVLLSFSSLAYTKHKVTITGILVFQFFRGKKTPKKKVKSQNGKLFMVFK